MSNFTKNSNLKKKIGETAYHYLARNFSDDFLFEHLPTFFFSLSEIRQIKEEELPKIKKLLNTKTEEKKEEKKPTKTAKEMLAEAGFILHDEINTKKDYMIFKKYFENDEKLCKFSSYDATKRYSRLFWITKQNINEIQRPDKPSRQDEYSTSCMSIGISQDKKNVHQITSRYNHTVSGCDNTYNSNLDNIVPGLTQAFNYDYNLELGKTINVEFDNFYFWRDKYYHYFHEKNGHRFGANTIDGVYYDPAQYLIFDTYILDIKNKKIKEVSGSVDGFADLVQQRLDAGAKIEIRKGKPDENEKDDLMKIIFYKN